MYFDRELGATIKDLMSPLPDIILLLSFLSEFFTIFWKCHFYLCFNGIFLRPKLRLPFQLHAKYFVHFKLWRHRRKGNNSWNGLSADYSKISRLNHVIFLLSIRQRHYAACFVYKRFQVAYDWFVLLFFRWFARSVDRSIDRSVDR